MYVNKLKYVHVDKSTGFVMSTSSFKSSSLKASQTSLCTCWHVKSTCPIMPYACQPQNDPNSPKTLPFSGAVRSSFWPAASPFPPLAVGKTTLACLVNRGRVWLFHFNLKKILETIKMCQQEVTLMPPGFHQTSGCCHAWQLPPNMSLCWWMLPKLWRIEYVHQKISILHTEILQWHMFSANCMGFSSGRVRPKPINLSMLASYEWGCTWSITRNVYNTCIINRSQEKYSQIFPKSPAESSPNLHFLLMPSLAGINSKPLKTCSKKPYFSACLTNQLFQFSTRFLAVLTSNIPKPKSVFVCKYLVLSGSWDLKSHKNGGWPKDLNKNMHGTKHEPWEEQMQQLQFHREQQAQNPTVPNRTNSEKFESSSLDLEKTSSVGSKLWIPECIIAAYIFLYPTHV